jgi:hypothetical protein
MQSSIYRASGSEMNEQLRSFLISGLNVQQDLVELSGWISKFF